jgi:peptidoglycan/LPS O-acetylase OafA/YrhL
MLSADVRGTTAATTPAEGWRLGYRPALDGLRGVAILLVLLGHGYAPGVPRADTVGVVVFFVLSGYLITTLMLQERRDTGRVSLAAFYRRRALRLLPALVLALAFVAVLMQLLGRGAEISGDVVPTLLYYMNRTKAAGDDPGLLSHAWSLSIEEQFYIVWPLALVGLMAMFRGRLIPILALLLGLALLVAAWRAALWSPEAYNRVYWSTDTRADALLMGAGLAVLGAVRPLRAPAWLAWIAAAVLVGLAVVGSNEGLAMIGLLAAAVASALLIVAAVGSSLMTRLLSWRPLVYVGTISYGLYLFHRPIMRIGTTVDVAWPVGFLAMALLSLGAAWLSYRYVERPFLRLKHWSWAKQREAKIDDLESPVLSSLQRIGSS